MIFYRWKNWLVFCLFSIGEENNFKNGWVATNKKGINLWAYFLAWFWGIFSLIKEFYWQATLFDGIEEIIFDIIATSLRNSLFLCSSRKALENLPKTELPWNNVQPTFQFIGCAVKSKVLESFFSEVWFQIQDKHSWIPNWTFLVVERSKKKSRKRASDSCLLSLTMMMSLCL